METMNNIASIFGVISPIVIIFQYLYYNKISVFIHVRKIFMRRKDVNFEISLVAKYCVDDLGAMFSTIRVNMKNRSSLISRNENKIIFSMDTMIIEIRNDPDSFDEYHFEILVKNTNSSYKIAKDNLKQLDKVFEILTKDFKLLNVKYSFKSVFPKTNPFLGPSITKVGVDKIKRLYMVLASNTFISTLDENNNIQVNLNEVSYVDSSFREVREIAEVILII